MGRTHVSPIRQPNDSTCGPSALKVALHVLGINEPLEALIELCKTNRNGTTTKNLISAITKLNLPVLAIEYATLTHLQNSLRYHHHQVRAVMVSYLYDLNEKFEPHPDSGHWATVSSYAADASRIILLDSATGKRKSYAWQDFRSRWFDYDLKRKKLTKESKHFKLIRHWQPQLMLVIAKKVEDLPKFQISSSKVFLPR
jgi:ABC-type bacteriocin/lantibiotic exporter with double-glycine peptidase domain